MIYFKACPRCQTGDLVPAEDMYGKYLQCFQCGHVLYPTAAEEATKIKTLTSVKRRIAA